MLDLGTFEREPSSVGTTLTEQKCFKSHRLAQWSVCWVQPVLILVGAQRKIGAQRHEEKERCDLGRQPGDHDIDAGLFGRVGVCGGRDGATDGLQQQRKQIKGNERDGVEGWAKA